MKMIADTKIQIFDDNNEQIVLESEEQQEVITDFAYKKFILPFQTADYQVQLVKSDLQFVYLFTDQTITVRINSLTAEVRTITAFDMFSSDNIDTLFLNNDSLTTNANITVVEVKIQV
jgi:hypothetical protein